MDSTINRGILYGNHPPSHIFFTIRVQFNEENSFFENNTEDAETLFSSPLKRFDDAMDASEQLAEQLLTEKFKECSLVDVDPTETNGFHYYILDTLQNIVAAIGIDIHDFSKETIH